MMELKEYQSRTLDVFVRWRDALDDALARSETAAAALQTVGMEVTPDIQSTHWRW